MIENAVKLNLGCGKRILPGYTNIDLHNPRADVIHDLTLPLPYEDSSVDVILAEHIIEHFLPPKWPMVIRDWARVLKPEGEIIIHCPDIKRCARNLLADRPTSIRWLLPIFGGYSGPGQIHKNGFWLEKIEMDLKAVGIEVCEHWYLRDRKVTPTGFNIAVRGVKKCN